MRPDRSTAVVLDRADGAVAQARGRRVVRTTADETLDDALHRRLGGAALRGAIVGATLLAAVTVGVAVASGISVPASAGLAGAVGLTGGPFFGSLAGFGLGLRLVERMRHELGDDLDRSGTVLVLPARLQRRWAPGGRFR